MSVDIPTVVLATDPDGGRHVLFAAAERDGERRRREGLPDLAARRAPGAATLGSLVATTRLANDDALSDLFAHLVDLPGADEPPERAVDVSVRCVNACESLPDELAGPAGGRFLVRRGSAPASLRARALLFANEHAPSGPGWSTIGVAPFEIGALGALLARTGLFGASARGVGGPEFESHVAAWLGELALRGVPTDGLAAEVDEAIAELLRAAPRADEELDPVLDVVAREDEGSDVRSGAGARRVAAACRADDDGVRVEVELVGATSDDPRDEALPRLEWICARWTQRAVRELERARRDRLFPYWLLVFEGPEGHPPVFTTATSARRWLAGRTDLEAGTRENREFAP
ncbi:MAG: hypothetical protein R3F34_12975 [Planctomycetota bacterium]